MAHFLAQYCLQQIFYELFCVSNPICMRNASYYSTSTIQMSNVVHFTKLGNFEIPKNDIALTQLLNGTKNVRRPEIRIQVASNGGRDLKKCNNQIILHFLPFFEALENIFTKCYILAHHWAPFLFTRV